LNAVFNLAPFFIGKRQTSADGPTQFVKKKIDGWRGRTFLPIFFWRRAICRKNHTPGPVVLVLVLVLVLAVAVAVDVAVSSAPQAKKFWRRTAR
jgi:anti-sigma factor RsiW